MNVASGPQLAEHIDKFIEPVVVAINLDHARILDTEAQQAGLHMLMRMSARAALAQVVTTKTTSQPALAAAIASWQPASIKEHA
jgi:hypothetical protein